MTFEFVRFAAVLVVLHLIPAFSLDSNDGWIPLTENEILRKLDRDFIRETFDNKHFIYPPNKESDEMEILKRDAIKMVSPQERFLILPSPANMGTVKSQIEQKKCDNKGCGLLTTADKMTDDIGRQDETEESNNDPQESALESNKRRPKHIHEVTKYFKNDPVENKQADFFYIRNSEDASYLNKNTESIQRIYQVTENVSEFNEDETTSEQSGYTYKYPELNARSTQIPNITDSFLEKLFKYNIKVDDDLPNYTLSRQPKGPRPNFMLIPMPLNIPPRINSFNHFSVDPLLAVFLSNYGYYVPGSYGIQNKYKNLYGYLASNNIHNNKPFGAYKLYSDTDSSY